MSLMHALAPQTRLIFHRAAAVSSGSRTLNAKLKPRAGTAGGTALSGANKIKLLTEPTCLRDGHYLFAHLIVFSRTSQGLPGPPGEKGENGDVGPMVKHSPASSSVSSRAPKRTL